MNHIYTVSCVTLHISFSRNILWKLSKFIFCSLFSPPTCTYTVQHGSNPSNHSIQQQNIKKRHGGAHPNTGGNDDKSDDENTLTNSEFEMKAYRKFTRCGHISSPADVVVGTPLLRDLNSDGRLDIMYDVVWSAAALSQLLVVASDLEVLFERAYGKGILDFDTFLPPGKQPWTQYMGRDGDCVFRLYPPSKDTHS